MIIIYFLFLCFLLLFLVSLFINKKAHNYEGRTEGEIISIKESYHYYRLNKVYAYYPIYQYEVNSITYQAEFPFGEGSSSAIHIGEKVIIQYDKKNPENFIVSGKENAWLGQAIFGLIMSIIMLAIIIGKYLGL